MAAYLMRPTARNRNKKGRRDATPHGHELQFDDGGNITVSALDRNDLRCRHLRPHWFQDGNHARSS